MCRGGEVNQCQFGCSAQRAVSIPLRFGEAKMQNLPFVGPLGPIIGALVGAAISALVTYHFAVKRKVLRFWVTNSEDITLPLRRHYKDVVFKVSGRDFLNLNRSSVFVENRGNTTISEFRFDIEIVGDHPHYLAELAVADEDLRKAVNITWDEPATRTNPRFHIDVSPFLNRGESFQVLLYFDGKSDDCNVHCRIEDVKTRVRRGKHVNGAPMDPMTDPLLWLIAIFVIFGAIYWTLARLLL
jgi:hypothetical protein